MENAVVQKNNANNYGKFKPKSLITDIPGMERYGDIARFSGNAYNAVNRVLNGRFAQKGSSLKNKLSQRPVGKHYPIEDEYKWSVESVPVGKDFEGYRLYRNFEEYLYPALYYKNKPEYYTALVVHLAHCIRKYMQANEVLHILEKHMFGNDIPWPTFIIQEGQGSMSLVWLVDKVPARLKKEFFRVQRELNKALIFLGSDGKNFHDVNGFRVPGSIAKDKFHGTCKVKIYHYDPIVYDFSELDYWLRGRRIPNSEAAKMPVRSGNEAITGIHPYGTATESMRLFAMSIYEETKAPLPEEWDFCKTQEYIKNYLNKKGAANRNKSYSKDEHNAAIRMRIVNYRCTMNFCPEIQFLFDRFCELRNVIKYLAIDREHREKNLRYAFLALRATVFSITQEYSTPWAEVSILNNSIGKPYSIKELHAITAYADYKAIAKKDQYGYFRVLKFTNACLVKKLSLTEEERKMFPAFNDKKITKAETGELTRNELSSINTERAFKMWEEGITSTKEIANKIRVSERTVRRYLKSKNIEISNRTKIEKSEGHPKSAFPMPCRIVKVHELLKAGTNKNAICRMLNLSCYEMVDSAEKKYSNLSNEEIENIMNSLSEIEEKWNKGEFEKEKGAISETNAEENMSIVANEAQKGTNADVSCTEDKKEENNRSNIRKFMDAVKCETNVLTRAFLLFKKHQHALRQKIQERTQHIYKIASVYHCLN